jgi:hypothetical protein
MKKRVISIIVCAMVIMVTGVGAEALTISMTAGDVDFGADRDLYDQQTNMDYFVFAEGSGESGTATNSLGWIAWDYEIPNVIDLAFSGEMTVRAWDIDPDDQMDVYFNFGTQRVYAGELLGSNGGYDETWENAVAAGTTQSLNGWSISTFSFSQELLDALTNSSGFELELDVQNNSSSAWAAVIDYAAITLDYEPGDPNPNYAVPEPGTILLLGAGLIGLIGVGRNKVVKKK